MLRLYLVRHGETDWNREKRYLGHTDLPLNQNGEWEVSHLRENLREVLFERCYTSDLRRARQTATTILGGRDVQLIEELALRELDFGEWEGLTYDEICQRYPQEAQKWVESGGRSSPFDGEDLGDLEVRVASWLNSLLAENIKGNILVVTHGGPVRILLCLLLGISSEKHWQFNVSTAGLAVVEVHEGQGILCALNSLT
ncbi:MAG: alpha-ribazole phosphatase [Firmicutes bacterium]|nr:alpha-ribazole phosphatase [Bacillota bacterium]